MENQHRKITGYRELTQVEVDKMNAIKEIGTALEKTIDALRVHPGVDHRWVSIGETHLQQGLMALTRAVAKPTSF